MKNIKKRNWAFVCYPDSLPLNWEELLINSGVPCAISPLHDKDIDPTGEPKKPHYHVILAYDNTTTYNNVKQFIEQFNCPNPQPLESVRGYYRYLTHKDNPEKYQYDSNDIVCFNGFDSSNFNDMTPTQIEALKDTLIDFIICHDIYEYSDLIEELHQNELLREMEKVARNNTTFFNSYISSRRYKKEKEIERKKLVDDAKRSFE